MPFTLPETIIQRGKNSTARGDVLKFPDNLGIHGMLMIFKKYTYTSDARSLLNSGNITQTEIKDAIMLPLPANIQDTYSVRLNPFEQGIGGAAVSDLSSTLTGAESFGEGFQAVQQRIMDVAPSGADVAGSLREIFESAMGRSSGNVNLNALASAAAFLARRTVDRFGGARNIDVGTGNTINPRAALSFEGVDMKRHSFEWTLTPSNSNESNTIRLIENAIKRNSLPSYTQFGQIQRALLNYPSMVDIYFFGIDSDYFIRFKTCMINSTSFGYTPQGLAILKGGKPAAVTISLQMTESDIHSSGDYGGDDAGVIVSNLPNTSAI